MQTELPLSITISEIPVPNAPFILQNGDLAALLETAARAGFSGVELQIADPAAQEPEQIRSDCERLGISVVSIATGLACKEGLSLSAADERVRLRSVERINAQTDLARRLNCRRIQIGLMIGKKSAHARSECYFAALSESLKQVATHAKQAGILLCLEPINHHDSDALNTWDETVAFLEECGCAETIALALDLYHMRFEERDLVATIEKHAGRIGSVQMMDDNGMAPGFGNFRFERITDAVLRARYCGPITMECLPLPNPETAMRAAVAFYKKYFNFKTNGV